MLDKLNIDELNSELDSIRRLLGSHDWGVWIKFLKRDRKEHLQKKVNMAVRNGNINDAQCALTLLDDCDRQLELFKSYIKKLEGAVKEKGKR